MPKDALKFLIQPKNHGNNMKTLFLSFFCLFSFRSVVRILLKESGSWDTQFVDLSCPWLYSNSMCFNLSQGRTGYLANGHISKHMLIGGINALPYSSHMPTMYIGNLIQISSKMQISWNSWSQKKQAYEMGNNMWLIGSFNIWSTMCSIGTSWSHARCLATQK